MVRDCENERNGGIGGCGVKGIVRRGERERYVRKESVGGEGEGRGGGRWGEFGWRGWIGEGCKERHRAWKGLKS